MSCIRHSLCAFLSLFGLVLGCAAEKPTPKPQESFAPYWTTESGWNTELQLKNNLAASSLTVTPVLRLADGGAIPLDPVTIASNAVESIDVNAALANRVNQFSGAPMYGSVAFRYTSKHAKNLYAAVMIHRHGEPIGYHVDAWPVYFEAHPGSREGIWWRPREGVKDLLIFSSSSDQQVTGKLSFFDASGKQWSKPLVFSPHQTQRMSIGELIPAAGLSGSYGGIKFELTNNAGVIDSLHVLYDETAGFSAMMKMFDRDPGAKLEERTWAGNKQWTTWAPMFALATPDPALGFPDATRLRPLLFLYNPTAKAVPAVIALTWRNDASTGKVALPSIVLKPFETKQLDIGSMQKKLGVPDDAHWALVTLTAAGAPPDALVALAASYDSTLRYGAQTPFSDQLAEHWVGGEWQVDATHNTISAIGNGGDRPTDVLLTLHYNGGTEKYEVQKTIPAGGQLWLDFGKLIHNNLPDSNGHTMPPSLEFGTYDIVDLKPGLGGNLFEGKVILDKTYGNLAYGCVQCCGYYSTYLLANPTNVVVNGLQNVDSWGENDCNGNQYQLNRYYSGGTWWSGNDSIAHITSLQARGVSGGSTNGYARAQVPTDGVHSCPMPYKQAQNACTTQTPTASRIEQNLLSYALTDGAGCPAKQNGWYRQVLKLVTDQNGNDIVLGGQYLTETVTVGSKNQLNVGKPAIGHATTNSAGQFQDYFFVCSPYCPGSGETDATQAIDDTMPDNSLYHLTPNALAYTCTNITVNSQ